MQFLQDNFLPIAILAFFAWRFFSTQRAKAQLPTLLGQGAQIVDVRSTGEFSSGAAPNSKNIPLHELPQRLQELDKKRPVILCCASGMRASSAVGILKAQGFTSVVNVGSWQNAVA